MIHKRKGTLEVEGEDRWGSVRVATSACPRLITGPQPQGSGELRVAHDEVGPVVHASTVAALALNALQAGSCGGGVASGALGIQAVRLGQCLVGMRVCGGLPVGVLCGMAHAAGLGAHQAIIPHGRIYPAAGRCGADHANNGDQGGGCQWDGWRHGCVALAAFGC